MKQRERIEQRGGEKERGEIRVKHMVYLKSPRSCECNVQRGCVRVKERGEEERDERRARGCTWSYARERRLVDVTQFM